DGRGLSPSTADRAGRWIFDRDGVLVRTRSRGVERRGAVRGAAEKLRRLLDELRRIFDLRIDLYCAGNRCVDSIRTRMARARADDRRQLLRRLAANLQHLAGLNALFPSSVRGPHRRQAVPSVWRRSSSATVTRARRETVRSPELPARARRAPGGSVALRVLRARSTAARRSWRA